MRVVDGYEAYLAIIAGVPDPEMFALLLDPVPGIATDDWQPEPSPLADHRVQIRDLLPTIGDDEVTGGANLGQRTDTSGSTTVQLR